jgi:hypothetical protein
LDTEKDESRDKDGCKKFVMDHINDCENMSQRLNNVNITFLGEKSVFCQPEILLAGHLCGAYGRKPFTISERNPANEGKSQMEAQRFLGACAFNHILIPQYAHVPQPLHGLRKKKRRFEWMSGHTLAIRRLKILLLETPI